MTCRVKAKEYLEDEDELWSYNTTDNAASFTLSGLVCTFNASASDLNHSGLIFLVFEIDTDANTTLSKIVELELTPDAVTADE